VNVGLLALWDRRKEVITVALNPAQVGANSILKERFHREEKKGKEKTKVCRQQGGEGLWIQKPEKEV